MQAHRVQKILIGDSIVTNVALGSLTNGQIGVYKKDFTPFTAAIGAGTPAGSDVAAEITAESSYYFGTKTATGIYLSDEIVQKNIVSKIAKDSSVIASQVSEHDPATLDPTPGDTYILRIVYLHNKEIFSCRPNVWFYTVVAPTGADAAARRLALMTSFRDKINADTHQRNQITAALVNTDHLQLTGKDYNVFFESAMIYSDSSSDTYTEFTATTVTNSAEATQGNGYWNEVIEIENFVKGHYGFQNRRAFPVDDITYQSQTGYFDMITIAHQQVRPSTETRHVYNSEPVSTIIALSNADAASADASYALAKVALGL